MALKFWGAKAQQEALMRIGGWIADNGIAADSAQYRAGRDLLLAAAPRAGQAAGAPLAVAGESGSEAALRLATAARSARRSRSRGRPDRVRPTPARG